MLANSPLNVIVALVPEHTAAVLELVADKAGIALMVILAPLSEPFTGGVLLTILILYPVPFAVAEGMVMLILWLPLPSDETVCKLVGEVKDPEASDS